MSGRGNGSDTSTTASVEEVLTVVRQGGGRVTTSRRLLLRALFEASAGHQTAEELAAAVQSTAPDIHISTIYRNLDELERLGVVRHAHLGHGPAIYHLASSAHGHFVCEACGAVLEAPKDFFLGMAEAAQLVLDFQIDPYHFAILGLCGKCA